MAPTWHCLVSRTGTGDTAGGGQSLQPALAFAQSCGNMPHAMLYCGRQKTDTAVEDTMATTANNTRLDVRLGEEQKRLIEQAAGFLGQTISAFTVATLVQQAEQVVERFGMLHLSDRDRDTFLAALDQASKPNAKLRQAAKRHAKQVAQ
jgi:uncharacterized protein (DUF1778 family)